MVVVGLERLPTSLCPRTPLRKYVVLPMWRGALDRHHRSMHPLQYIDLARDHQEELRAQASRRRLARLVRRHGEPEAA